MLHLEALSAALWSGLGMGFKGLAFYCDGVQGQALHCITHRDVDNEVW